MGIVRPVMEVFPYAWAFFVPYIVVTTFAVLNLFIGIIVSAMQAEHEQTLDEERTATAEVAHGERQTILSEIKGLKQEIAALRAAVKA